MTNKKMPEEIRDYFDAHIDAISDVSFERIIISSIIKDPEVLYDVKEVLDVDDFGGPINLNLIGIIYDLFKDNNVQRITPNVIRAFAEKSNIDIGGENYLKVLAELEIGDEQNISYYINEVKNLSIRRKSAKEAIKSIEDSINVKEEDKDTFIARQEERFTNILLGSKGYDDVVHLSGSLIKEKLNKRAKKPKDIIGIPTGFREFDFQVGGLVPGTLTCVSAFTKTGKSALLANWAVYVALEEGIPVLYLDTEMNDEEFMDRILAIVASMQGTIVTERSIMSGLFSKNKNAVEAVEVAINLIGISDLYHLYMPDFTLEKVINTARRFKKKYGVRFNDYEDQVLVIFDYIKMPDDSDLRAAQEYQQLGFFTNGLKNKLAGKENIPVLTAAQLNRENQIGGSLKILQFVNTLCYLRNKTDKEQEKDGHWDIAGNQILSIDENSTRRGGQYKGWIRNYKPKGVVLLEEIRNVSLV